MLTAMLGAEAAPRGLRVSLGEDTTDAEVAYAASAFRRVLARGA